MAGKCSDFRPITQGGKISEGHQYRMKELRHTVPLSFNVIPSRSSHHPQFTATGSPNPTFTSPLAENRCGYGQDLVPVPAESTLVLATQMHINEYNWLPGTPLCPPLLRHRAWGRTLPKTLLVFSRDGQDWLPGPRCGEWTGAGGGGG